MRPLTVRNLLIFSALIYLAVPAHAQNIHLDDLMSLRNADSASFRSFCRRNGLEKERMIENGSIYILNFQSETRALIHSWVKKPSDTVYTINLNYSFKDKKEHKQLLKEMKKAGFDLQKPRSKARDLYRNGNYWVSLQTNLKNGKFMAYGLSLYYYKRS